MINIAKLMGIHFHGWLKSNKAKIMANIITYFNQFTDPQSDTLTS